MKMLFANKTHDNEKKKLLELKREFGITASVLLLFSHLSCV